MEKLHDKIGAFEWGIPQELVPMYRRGYAKINLTYEKVLNQNSITRIIKNLKKEKRLFFVMEYSI